MPVGIVIQHSFSELDPPTSFVVFRVKIRDLKIALISSFYYKKLVSEVFE